MKENTVVEMEPPKIPPVIGLGMEDDESGRLEVISQIVSQIEEIIRIMEDWR